MTPLNFGVTLMSLDSGGWKTSKDGMKRLVEADRIEAYGNTLAYRRFAADFPYSRLSNLWDDTVTGGYAEQRFYVVQTNSKVIQRCILDDDGSRRFSAGSDLREWHNRARRRTVGSSLDHH